MFEILYGDGTEFRVAWDGAARAEVLASIQATAKRRGVTYGRLES